MYHRVVRAANLPIILILVVAIGGATSCRSADTSARPPGAPADEARVAPDTEREAANETEPASSGAPVLVQPGAPGEPTRVISAEEAVDLSGVQATEADVRFMQGMIHHHAQALTMTALVPERTERDDMRALALRIELSQEDEIGMMQRWLELHGEEVPTVHEQHGADAPMMPGMLTAEQMAELAAAEGAAFDRLFLEGMVRHHQGALVMVDELYAVPGAGQETNISAFAAEVVADQGAEIARMNAMLNAMLKEPRE